MTAEHVDAVVIGSGFGGAVTAFRLAEAGRSVVLLERGRPFPPGSFPRTPLDAGRALWDPAGGRHGMAQVWRFGGVDALVSSGLGGGSLIYANVLLRKDPEFFPQRGDGEDPDEHWPLGYEDLVPHYEHVEAMIAPTPYPYADSTPKTRALLEAGERLGLDGFLPPLAIQFAGPDGRVVPGAPIVDRWPSLHALPRSTCRLCGACDVGCDFGAKTTLDHSYLAAAHAAGAQLRTGCEVHSLARRLGGGLTVGYHQHAAIRDSVAEHLRDHDPAERRELTADHVVLAAGVLGTTKLLLANRAGLPGLSRTVGTRFSTNGDLLGFVRNARTADGGVRELLPSRGPVITATLRERVGDRGFYLQDGGAPAMGEWLWHLLEAPQAAWGARHELADHLRARLHHARKTDASEVLGALMGDARVSAAMMPVLGMGRDVADGRLRLGDDGTLQLNWSAKGSKAHYDRLEQAVKDVAEALGGFGVTDPLGPLGGLVTVHPLGGAPMGESAATGVVDARGRVHDIPGLHVHDGAALPGAVGPNPSLTIAACADRGAEAILEAG